MSWISRIVNALRPGRLDGEIGDELRFHFEERVDELARGGMTRREAERAARLKFGGALQVKESSREAKSATWVESALADFRFGARMLRKSRNASLAAIASLGLAIGACTAAFALLDALVFRELPLPRAERLVRLAHDGDGFLWPEYEVARDSARSSADWFAMQLAGGLQPARFDDAGAASENVRVEAISGRGFEILGVRAALGRLIQPEDDRGAVAVLSHAFWRRRFGASPSAIGKRVNIGGRPMQIVGVAARGFSGVQPGYLTDLWTSLTPPDPRRGSVQVWGRLRDGEVAGAVEAPLGAALAHFTKERAARRGKAAPVRVLDGSRGRDSLFRMQFETPLRIFALICGLLLLVACSNVGCLLIARAAAREREMTLRTALGASRWRLMQQMLVESGQLAAAAAAVGLGVAAFAAPAIAARLGTTEFPAWVDAAMDWRTLAFALGVSAVTTVVCGAAPAVRARPLRAALAAQVA
ncbi:MAG TPA: ABC transporter permease, partial [Terriglobales bacterium]|nr:ABC transporter permease [Terriglobales bacterium]